MTQYTLIDNQGKTYKTPSKDTLVQYLECVLEQEDIELAKLFYRQTYGREEYYSLLLETDGGLNYKLLLEDISNILN